MNINYNMSILWMVSFRPVGKSKNNDFYQNMFVDSLISLDHDITLSLTQFEEANVKKFIDNKKIKKHFINVPKTQLPNNKKYSNKIMLDNALSQYIDNKYEYLVYSTADIIVPSRLFKVISQIQIKEFCAFIYPNIHISNDIIKNNFWPHFGIDLIVFKLSKENAIKFKKIAVDYDQYDWGIIENFYISICELLNLEKINLFKHINVIKFNNDFVAFDENRETQIKSWKENQKYFATFLKKNKLSKLYAYGSYYYLLYKVFNFKDLNFKLFLSYLIFYPYYFIKKIMGKFKKIF